MGAIETLGVKTMPEASAMAQPSIAPNYTQMRGIAIKGETVGPGKQRVDRKPYAPSGYEWHAQSKGFVCRRIVYDGGKRRRVYVGFLSGKAWADMKAAHRGADLTAAVKAWIGYKEQAGMGGV